MTVGLWTAGFAISLLCALVMGYAIQRGATCTVAAVSQLMLERKWGRIVGLMEAALWVAGGLLVARALGFLPQLPSGHAVTGTTVAGGILLGAGAYINRACVFGTISNIGSRNWAYLATPIGFLAGTWAAALFGARLAPGAPVGVSPLATLPGLVLVVFVIFAGWRIVRTAARRHASLTERIWAPHEATVVIGITFTILFVAAGAWAYTDLLTELAKGMPGDLWVRLILFLALLTGSMVAGSANAAATSTRFDLADCLRTFVGGGAMGAGSFLIPGSNDGLILVGMPLLFPFAWVGIASMCLTIAGAIMFDRWRAIRVSARHATN